MSITIIKNGVRVATYHYKQGNVKKTIAAIKAFYKGLYSGTGAVITYKVEC